MSIFYTIEMLNTKKPLIFLSTLDQYIIDIQRNFMAINSVFYFKNTNYCLCKFYAKKYTEALIYTILYSYMFIYIITLFITPMTAARATKPIIFDYLSIIIITILLVKNRYFILSTPHL